MSYYRLYPTKNNTIIESNKITDSYKNINSGKLTIMELHKGEFYSELIFKFEIPDWLKNNWANIDKVNLKLYDAGAIYSNVLGETEIKITSFYDDFIEGNGFSLIRNNAHNGYSNFNFAKELIPWNTKNTSSTYINYDLDNVHQDIDLNVKNIIDINEDFVCFKVNVSHQDFSERSRIKFIFSRHSGTIYKPYLEFFINDLIHDKKYDCRSGMLNKIYLINQTNQDFNGTLTCNINSISTSVINNTNGIYYVELNPTPNSEIARIEWFLDGEKIHQDIINVKENYTLKNINYNSLTFYITNGGINNTVYRVGDILRFDVMSFIKGVNNFVYSNYEFRVVTNTGFEMIPWSKCNIYNDKIFFFLDTSYFYPELDYEISLRLRDGNIVKTNKDNFKFKLTNQNGNKLHDFSNNPYYTRDWFFSAK